MAAASHFAGCGEYPQLEDQLLRLLRPTERLASIHSAWLTLANAAFETPLLVASTNAGDLLVVSSIRLKVRVPRGSWQRTFSDSGSIWRFIWWGVPVQFGSVRRPPPPPPAAEAAPSNDPRDWQDEPQPRCQTEVPRRRRASWRRKPSPPSLQTWEEAEQFAADHMRKLGFRDAAVTPPRADGGIDVRARRGQAQVKATSSAVGRPALQQLVGACKGPWRLFYSLNGYTSGAIAYANKEGIALFVYSLDRAVQPWNRQAKHLMRRGPKRAF